MKLIFKTLLDILTTIPSLLRHIGTWRASSFLYISLISAVGFVGLGHAEQVVMQSRGEVIFTQSFFGFQV